MKKVLVIFPLNRDRRELDTDFFKAHYHILFHDFNIYEVMKSAYTMFTSSEIDIPKVIDELYHFAKREQVDGILSSDDYMGGMLVSILASKLNLPGPDPALIITQQNKYYARQLQQRYVPEATPSFFYIDGPVNTDITVPIFVKPIRAMFSIGANAARTEDELAAVLNKAFLPKKFIDPYDYLMKKYSSCTISPYGAIAEELLMGVQCTLEGFVYNKKITILGIVDSVMAPGTISFIRFDYPSHLPKNIQDRMNDITKRLITGIGLDMSFFNIEFMYNPEKGTIHIIELNPRFISQFADLYEKVDGTNSYQLLLQLATGVETTVQKGMGNFNCAASCVLREYENKRVTLSSTELEIEKVYERFPGVRIKLYVKEGELLSDTMQDGKTFRYGLVHLGGESVEDIQHKFDVCKRMLNITFEAA